MTTATELRELAETELVQRLDEAQRELFNLRFQLATSQSTKTAELAKLKREIARIMTIRQEREHSLPSHTPGTGE